MNFNTALTDALSVVKNAPQNVGNFINDNISWPIQKAMPGYQQNVKNAQAYQTMNEARQLQAMGQIHDAPKNNYIYSGITKPQVVSNPIPQILPATSARAEIPTKFKRESAKLNTSMEIPQSVKNNITVPPISPTASPTPTPEPTVPPSQFVDAYEKNTPQQYVQPIAKAAQKYGVPMSILSSMLAHESMTWNPDVISGKMASSVGAQGIAQFMPATAKGMGIDPLNTDQAIEGAARKLAGHFKQFGSWPLALAAYNAGAGHVADYLNGTNYTGNNPNHMKTGGIPDFVETRNYIPHILDRAKKSVTKYGQ